jgi:hypothetical protein
MEMGDDEEEIIIRMEKTLILREEGRVMHVGRWNGK